jgi:predicted HTH transcriptional regulator
MSPCRQVQTGLRSFLQEVGVTEQEFRDYIQLGHEQRGVEFKGPGPSSDPGLLAKVVRAVLGMANKRDGGRVIVGVDEVGTTVTATGLTSIDLATWRHDLVAEKVASYADSPVGLDGEPFRYEGRDFFVITVKEFDQVPVVCRKDCPDPAAGSRSGRSRLILRKGSIYVRSMASPGTTGEPTQAELRDLLDLATEKGVRRFLETAGRVGLAVPGPTPVPSDDERYAAQAGDLND